MADCYDSIKRNTIQFEYIQGKTFRNNDQDPKTAKKSEPLLSMHSKKVTLKKTKKKIQAFSCREPAKSSKEIYDFISYN